ncbi:unnamed protein product [Arabidopsis halleri]
MSQPSTSIHEMSFSCELLFVKLYCDRVELQPFVLVNLGNRVSLPIRPIPSSSLHIDQHLLDIINIG